MVIGPGLRQPADHAPQCSPQAPMTDGPHIPDRDDDEPSQPRDDAAAVAGPGAAERAEPRADAPGDPAFTTGDPLGDEPERPVFGFTPVDEPARRLTRSWTDRMVGGVAGALGHYFDVDPLLFRIGFVVLTFAGGFGILAYLVGLAAIPPDGEMRPQRWGLARTVGVGLLACAAVATITPHWFWGPGVPGLVALGVVLYLLVRVLRDEGGSHLAHVAARIAL